MKKIIVFLFLCLMSVAAWSQSVTDGSFRTIGFIKSDGTMQDSSFRTIGHTKGIPMYPWMKNRNPHYFKVLMVGELGTGIV